jgi:hypothetical protein
LLLTDAKSTEPKEPTDISEWNRELEKSKAVVNKTSPLFVGIRALPSFNDRAGGALNATDLVISVLRNEMIVAAPPIQGAASTTTIAASATIAATHHHCCHHHARCDELRRRFEVHRYLFVCLN